MIDYVTAEKLRRYLRNLKETLDNRLLGRDYQICGALRAEQDLSRIVDANAEPAPPTPVRRISFMSKGGFADHVGDVPETDVGQVVQTLIDQGDTYISVSAATTKS